MDQKFEPEEKGEGQHPKQIKGLLCKKYVCLHIKHCKNV